MFKRLFKHMRSNSGDSNVSKMTIIAIAFVVGAILLVLTTSAFRNPINRWFGKVTNGWFAEENGMYEADNKFLFAERLQNGTIKGATYIYYWEDDDGNVGYCKLTAPERLTDGQNSKGVCMDELWPGQQYEWWGSYTTDQYYFDISDDGSRIDMIYIQTGEISDTFYAEFQD